MSTDLDISASLANAQTTFVERGSELFRQAILPGQYSIYTATIPNIGIWERHFLTNQPMMRQWTGSRQEKFMRAYKESLTPVSYEATMPIARLDLVRDKTGSIGKSIDDFFAMQVMAYDSTVASSIDGSSGAGPTGYDGQALYSTAHPHVNSSSGHSNLSSGTNLSHATFSTARAAMRKYLFENGQPMHIVPTHMRVSPDNEKRAKEIASAADRVVFTDTEAAETTSAVQNTTNMPNVWRGEVDVLVDPRITSNTYYWDLFDLSKGNMRPMVLIEERRPETISQDSMEGEFRFNNDIFKFGLEGEWKVGAGDWQTAYRATGTA